MFSYWEGCIKYTRTINWHEITFLGRRTGTTTACSCLAHSKSFPCNARGTSAKAPSSIRKQVPPQTAYGPTYGKRTFVVKSATLIEQERGCSVLQEEANMEYIPGGGGCAYSATSKLLVFNCWPTLPYSRKMIVHDRVTAKFSVKNSETGRAVSSGKG